MDTEEHEIGWKFEFYERVVKRNDAIKKYKQQWQRQCEEVVICLHRMIGIMNYLEKLEKKCILTLKH